MVQPRDMLESGPVMEQELIAFCRQRLSAIKCPRSIDFEEQLPSAATGKLRKQLLRDRYWMAFRQLSAEGLATRRLYGAENRWAALVVPEWADNYTDCES